MNAHQWLLRRLRRGARFVGLWVLPPLVLVLLLAVGLVWWCAASQTGTRWLLRTAVAQFDGQIHGISGTLARGLTVDDLSLTVPDAQVQVMGLHLQVLWPELRAGHLHVSDSSAVRVVVHAQTSPHQAAAGPLHLPVLPVAIRVDRLALGGLDLWIDGKPLPVELQSLSTALTLDDQGATLALGQLQAAYGDTQVTLDGNATLHGLAAPWPFDLDLHASVQGLDADSPACLQQVLGEKATGSTDCHVQMQTRVTGTADALHVQASGTGQGLQLQSEAEVYPNQAFPLGDTRLDLSLPGNMGLQLAVNPQAAAADGSRVIQAQFTARGLNPGRWLPKDVGATLLNLQGSLQADLTASRQLRDLALQLDVTGPSRWNGSPLSGHVRIAHLGRNQGVLLDTQAPGPWDRLGLVATGLDLDLAVGPDRIRGKGDAAASASHLSLRADVPALKALWPGLSGGGTLSLTSDGPLTQQKSTLELHFVPADSQAGVPGRAPLVLALATEGGWAAATGWKGRLTTFRVAHAGLTLDSRSAIPLAVDSAGAWQIGRATLDVGLDGQSLLQLQHQASSGSPGQWATQGHIDPLVITPARIVKIQKWLGRAGVQAGGVQTALSQRDADSKLATRLDWNLKFKGALSGDIRLTRTGGDLTVPGAVPIHLGLQAASLDLVIRPGRDGTSAAHADLQIRTEKMGSLHVQADTPVHSTPGGGISLRTRDVKHLQIQADSEDLAWVNLLLDGAVEVGGTVHADIRGQSRPDGRWTFSGPLRAQGLRILSVDQGVRLLDGVLQAHLDDSRVVLDHLRFPAVRRVTPKEWRTATWVSENPDAQNGDLDISGDWDLYTQRGQVQIAFRRYPILQRADRYAMVSGDIAVQASLPEIRINGKIVADAGWFDLDMLNNIPSLDSDVVVLQPGKSTAPAPATPLDLSVDMTVDLGPRFYLTGYGVDSGLVGSLNLQMRKGKLTALGALRTRGGAINVYGQHLQLRHGTVTFQGDIGNPVLSIEALRTGVAVQAGVKVSGTARHPRIGLVSHPDVSETEKLTWLLLGHGPDEGGAGDVSLLFSVGSSLLSGGEPFYKRFGLDELSMRNGELGSSGSVLPVQTVVSDPTNSASPAEQRFVVASKTVTDNLKVSLEQALAQTGTVARLSYRILRRLQGEVTVGTVNGLALVYRWFSKD